MDDSTKDTSSPIPKARIEHQFTIEDNLVEIRTPKHKAVRFLRKYWRSFVDELRLLFRFHPKDWLTAFRRNPAYPFFIKGDIDGLVALFIDNLATLLAIILALQSVLDADIVYGKIVTG